MIATRRFGPLFAAQAFSVFSDHLFRNSVLFLVTYDLTTGHTASSSTIANIAMASFALPYFLFSSLSGELADRFDKARLARWVMMADVVVMLLAALGLYSRLVVLLVLVLFLAGTRATLFGPLKYAILPQHLARAELVTGSALIQASSFVAIVAGQTAGGLLGRPLAAGVLVALSVMALICAAMIPPAPAGANPPPIDPNIVRASHRIVRAALRNVDLRHAVFGLSWFYALGAVFTSQFVPFARNDLGFDETVATLFLVTFSIGIAAGSLGIAAFLKGEITMRLATPAAAILGLVIIDLYLVSLNIEPRAQLMTIRDFMMLPSAWRLLADLFGIAAAAAAFAVPFQAVLQSAGDADHRGRDLSANNIVNALLVVFALLVSALASHLGRTIGQIFLGLGIITLFIAAAGWRWGRSSYVV